MAIRFILDPSRPVEAEVRRVFLEQLTTAIHELKEDELDPDTVVHEVRKRIKRMRAVLRLVQDELTGEFRHRNRDLRDAGRTLSDIRDSHVAAVALSHLRGAYHKRLGREADRRIREAVDLLEAQRPSSSVTRGYKSIRKRTAKQLKPLKRWAEEWSFGQDGFAALAPGFRRTYRRGRDRMAEVQRTGFAADFHQWRKRVKDHMHHVELLDGGERHTLAARSRRLDQLSEMLGNYQDLQVIEEALTHPPFTRGHREACHRLLRDERERLGRTALELGSTIYWYRPNTLLKKVEAAWIRNPGPSGG